MPNSVETKSVDSEHRPGFPSWKNISPAARRQGGPPTLLKGGGGHAHCANKVGAWGAKPLHGAKEGVGGRSDEETACSAKKRRDEAARCAKVKMRGEGWRGEGKWEGDTGGGRGGRGSSPPRCERNLRTLPTALALKNGITDCTKRVWKKDRSPPAARRGMNNFLGGGKKGPLAARNKKRNPRFPQRRKDIAPQFKRRERR